MRPLTANAADPRAVRFARRKERDEAKIFDEALAEAMTSPATRLVLWDILKRAGIYERIEETNATIYYKMGKRNFGLELLADVMRVDERLYLVMESEARARQRSIERETAAVQTAASQGEQP